MNLIKNYEKVSPLYINPYFIYLIWVIALIPIIILRDYTPNNELRYLSIVDEALKNHRFFAFTLGGVPYADKPPLSFWLMMLGRVVLNGHRMWYLSLLSLIPAIVTIATMERFLRLDDRAKSQPESMLMLMTTGLFIGLSIIIRMDMLMVMFITLSLYMFYKIYIGKGGKTEQILFPIYIFLALFSKGPVGFLMPLLITICFLIYKKKINSWRNYWGWRSITILLVLCLIWFGCAYLEGGSSYLQNLIVHQTIDRGINSFHHKEPFYYYLIVIWYAIAPWIFLSLTTIIAAIKRKKIETDLEHFFITVILATFIMLSLFSSKLAVYILPIVPFIIYVTTLLLPKLDGKNIWLRLSIALPAFVFVLILPILFMLVNKEKTAFLNITPVYISAALLTCSGVYLLWILFAEKKLRKAIRTMSFSMLLAILVASTGINQINPHIGWHQLCKDAEQIAGQNGATDYCVYKISRSESMDVFLGKSPHEAEREQLLDNHFEGQILMTPKSKIIADDEIAVFLRPKQQYESGKYIIVVL